MPSSRDEGADHRRPDETGREARVALTIPALGTPRLQRRGGVVLRPGRPRRGARMGHHHRAGLLLTTRLQAFRRR